MAWNIQKCLKSESENFFLEVKKKLGEKIFEFLFLWKKNVAQNCLSCLEITLGGGVPAMDRQLDNRHRRVTSRVASCSSKARSRQKTKPMMLFAGVLVGSSSRGVHSPGVLLAVVASDGHQESQREGRRLRSQRSSAAYSRWATSPSFRSFHQVGLLHNAGKRLG